LLHYKGSEITFSVLANMTGREQVILPAGRMLLLPTAVTVLVLL